MLTWFFKLIKARTLKAQSHLPFASFRATKEVISSHILEMLEKSEKGYLALVKEFEELRHQVKEEARLVLDKDEFGVVKNLAKPLFTPGYVNQLKRKKLHAWAGIVGFTILETFLYYLVSNKIVNGLDQLFESPSRGGTNVGLNVASILISLLLALGGTWALDAGLARIYSIFQASEHHKAGNIGQAAYSKASVYRWKGVAMVALVTAFVTFVGIARIFMLHSADESGSTFLAFGLLIITILSGIYMGSAKLEADEASDALKLYAKWSHLRGSISAKQKNLTVAIESLRHQAALSIEKSYHLILDLQTIYEQEMDERDAQLLAEFRQAYFSGSLVLDDKTYLKYQSLQTNERVLHDYAFKIHERLNVMFTKAGEVEKYIREIDLDADQKPASSPQPGELFPVLTPANGKVRHGLKV